MRMTIIATLEKMAELNDEEILVQDNAGEPQTIESAIEEIRNFAEDPDEERDYYVTAEEIREIDEGGYIVTGCEAIYKRVEEEFQRADDWICNPEEREEPDFYYAVCQRGITIYGVGKTPEDAIEDAREWVSDYDDMIKELEEGNNSNVIGKMEMITISPAAKSEIEKVGGDIGLNEDEDGIYRIEEETEEETTMQDTIIRNGMNLTADKIKTIIEEITEYAEGLTIEAVVHLDADGSYRGEPTGAHTHEGGYLHIESIPSRVQGWDENIEEGEDVGDAYEYCLCEAKEALGDEIRAFFAWEKIEALKEQINAWDCEDAGALRDLIEQATEALKDYNEKYPSGAGPGKIEELIDFTSLPSADLPADLAEYSNYPIWACDKSGACLVGAEADEVQSADEIREALDLPAPTQENSKIIKLAEETLRTMSIEEIDKALEEEQDLKRRAALQIALQADNTTSVEAVASWYIKTDDKFNPDVAVEIRRGFKQIQTLLTKAKEEDIKLIQDGHIEKAADEARILFSLIEEQYIIPELLAQEEKEA